MQCLSRGLQDVSVTRLQYVNWHYLVNELVSYSLNRPSAIDRIWSRALIEQGC
jgi:hypothetical protein